MRTAARNNTNPTAIAWDSEAEDLLQKVPFFVRPFARRKIEEYVRSKGQTRVTASSMKAARTHFLGADSAAGAPQPPAQDSSLCQLDVCQAEEAGCPFAITPLSGLRDALARVFNGSGWREFLERSVTGPILHHHRLRVALCACPNACSQPQIKDIGIIAALRPTAVSDACTGCGRCAEACREGGRGSPRKTRSVASGVLRGMRVVRAALPGKDPKVRRHPLSSPRRRQAGPTSKISDRIGIGLAYGAGLRRRAAHH